MEVKLGMALNGNSSGPTDAADTLEAARKVIFGLKGPTRALRAAKVVAAGAAGVILADGLREA